MSCDDLGMFEPDGTQREGCEIIERLRAVLAPQGGEDLVVVWAVRDGNGRPVNLDCPTDSSQSLSVNPDDETGLAVKVRFGPCDFCVRCAGGEVVAEIQDAAAGKVRFTLPAEITAKAGIYVFNVGVFKNGKLVLVDKGILSIEPSLFGDPQQSCPTVPTVEEIRRHLRDTGVENELLNNEVQFSTPEIVAALLTPIRIWNEWPPDIARYTCSNFPYTHHWRQGVVAELLRAAAHNYMRNDMPVNHGGLQGNLKNKYDQFLRLAQQYANEYERFVRYKKTQLNLRQFSGRLGSPYRGAIW